MAETPYIETEALLLALQDDEADSGNTETLDEYLTNEFTAPELAKLGSAAELLGERCWKIRRKKTAEVQS